MEDEEFKEQRIKDNQRLGNILIDLCVRYNLRMMQLIAILNNDGDYFNEEPSVTIKRVLEFDKQHNNK